MTPIFVEYQPSNGGALLLSGTTVVGSKIFGGSFWASEYFEMLVLSIIDLTVGFTNNLRSSVSFVFFLVRIFPVRFNCDFHDYELFIRLVIRIVVSFGILKLEV